MKKHILSFLIISILLACVSLNFANASEAETTNPFLLLKNNSNPMTASEDIKHHPRPLPNLDELSEIEQTYAKQGMKDLLFGFHVSRFMSMPPAYVHSLIYPGFIDLNESYGENKVTILMIAAQYNPFPDVISLLMEGGADPKQTDSMGFRAINYAEKNLNLKGTPEYQALLNASF
jgi:hypothetical protein